jgi:membrane associated rhomboid family serine protease
VAFRLTAWATGDNSYLFTSSVGYSGVLFSYAVIEAFHSPEASRSVFGCFNVPTKAYPFILLVIIQFMLPNISLFGHLGGLLAGVLLMTSFGSVLFIPSQGKHLVCVLLLDNFLFFLFDRLF